MKKLSMMTSLAILLLTLVTASARPQRPATAPPTAPSGKPPDTVMLEELTWAEVHDLIAGGVTTDYYEASRVYYRAWLQAAFGYDEETAGSHAGITDTSQMLFIRPSGIRKDQIKPWGGPQDSGVSGDPAKATADIGKMGVEFKVNAGINQYKLLKNPPARGRGGRRGSGPDR